MGKGFRFCCVCVMVSILFLSGCGKKRVPVVTDSTKALSPALKSQKSARTADIKNLLSTAHALFNKGEYSAGMKIFGELWESSQKEAGDRAIVEKALDNALGKTPPMVILGLIEGNNAGVPRSLLLYWAGVNFGLEKEYVRANDALLEFVSNYPDHRYAQDAAQLLSIIRETFDRKDTIGCLLPLSGKYGVYGQRAMKGIQMAIQDLANYHGRPFNVVIKDTASNPERAMACVRELAEEKVIGILGPLLAVDGVGEVAQELKIPMIALTQKQEFPEKGEYLFSNFITPQMQVQALASYIFVELGLKKVAIFYPEERYGERYLDMFWNVTDQFKGEVVGVESYNGRNTDFTRAIQKLTGEAYYPLPEFMTAPKAPEGILAEDLVPEDTPPEEEVKEEETAPEIQFQAVFIPDAASRVNLILPQLAFNDAKGMYLLGTNLWHRSSLLRETRGYNKNTIITDGYFSGSRRPETARFDKAFRALYGQAPGFLEAVSYDTTKILFESAMGEGIETRDALKDHLQGHQIFEGVTGNTIFDETGQAHKQLFLLTIRRGRFVEIQ